MSSIPGAAEGPPASQPASRLAPTQVYNSTGRVSSLEEKGGQAIGRKLSSTDGKESAATNWRQ